MIDPPSGWRWGFPKEIPDDIWKGGKVLSWLIEQGYPQKEIDDCGDNFHCKYWLEEKA